MTYFRECEPAWCPGCGNFPLRKNLIETLDELKVPKELFVMVSGIGQAAKMPHYLELNFFNGLHGRSLPVAFAIKAVNPRLTVVAESGDGDMYGEGGNHFIHGIRRNIDITVLIHDNQIYGLTKGQGSPTTQKGQVTSSQLQGVINEPLNPLALTIAMDAAFVGRTFIGDSEHFKRVVAAAIRHRGFSVVDIMQPCVTFNKVNTFKYYKDRLYDVKEENPSYDPGDKAKAFEKSLEWGERIPMGIIYTRDKPSYCELHAVLKDGVVPVKDSKEFNLERELESFR
ncbi:2-oxoacid:acceptor oxidoreductase, beta subunit, pyruvate/2-ketoisovalerate family [Mesotoga infera]|uniref:2-oxoacid:acceptor oxidoreductase, beta subunit, pyruvate/2-ketoisovalerate family n=1 Tax=Mesotoga infera TaxID=1236046 RepID=A0A7Z7LHL1_9BACT|nr:thiamine pyrophosphate-dependent enzyme [Mesotoga infera]SSC14040.1 2-oxoacid:acceptor oxidoreductase, beta subunit, pyruvate/2-ketoisovalerate family [Mesotoga infera]